MKNHSQWIYLLTSNGSEKYMTDALETLALPFGTIQHFRYQIKWIPEAVRDELPDEKGKKGEKSLKNTEILICYLHQSIKTNEKLTWTAIYPLRKANLVYAYKTGDSKIDIAHFYFQVNNYVSYNKCEEIKNFMTKIKGKYASQKKFVFWEDPISYIAPEETSITAFNKICEELGNEIFESPDGKQKHFPIFCRIEGLVDNKDNRLEPKYNTLIHKSCYEFREVEPYALKFATYFPKEPLKFPIKILSTGGNFATPEEYEFEVSSRYDEASYLFISRLLNQDTWTRINFQTCAQASAKKKRKQNDNPLNLNINFFVKIKMNPWYRFIENLNTIIAFGFSAGVILLIPVILKRWTWWYTVIVILYLIYIASAFLLKYRKR